MNKKEMFERMWIGELYNPLVDEDIKKEKREKAIDHKKAQLEIESKRRAEKYPWFKRSYEKHDWYLVIKHKPNCTEYRSTRNWNTLSIY